MERCVRSGQAVQDLGRSRCLYFTAARSLPPLEKMIRSSARLRVPVLEIGRWEVIVVNDGSSDDSLVVLLAQRRQYPYLKVLDLSRNFGHQPALTAGLEHVSGRAVILMDGDLQDQPEAIPAFVDKWREGYAVVYAIREKRQESVPKRAAFAAFYWIQTRLSRIETPLRAGIFSLLDRTVVEVLKSMPERNRYLPGLRAYAGFPQTGVRVERGRRFEGEPCVGFGGLVKLAIDAIFGFATLRRGQATALLRH